MIYRTAPFLITSNDRYPRFDAEYIGKRYDYTDIVSMEC